MDEREILLRRAHEMLLRAVEIAVENPESAWTRGRRHPRYCKHLRLHSDACGLCMADYLLLAARESNAVLARALGLKEQQP